MDCPYTDAKCGRHAQCKACLIENIGSEWGGDFIKALHQTEPINMSFDKFLDECIACGGNWTGMILSGIKSFRPELYAAVPDHMGKRAWMTLGNTLLYLGVYPEG